MFKSIIYFIVGFKVRGTFVLFVGVFGNKEFVFRNFLVKRVLCEVVGYLGDFDFV